MLRTDCLGSVKSAPRAGLQDLRPEQSASDYTDAPLRVVFSQALASG